MNVRKLIARLNATSMRIQPGRAKKQHTVPGVRLSDAARLAVSGEHRSSLGEVEPALKLVPGIESITRVHGSQTWSWDPEKLTAIDIAGALGMVPNGLAREVFCAIWWPDGARLAANELRSQLMRRLRDEVTKRRGAALDAWLRMEFARADVREAAPAERRAAERALSAAKQALEEAKAREWPVDGERYSRLLDAALRNLEEARPCDDCKGEGKVLERGKEVACLSCGGVGQRALITGDVAESLGITRQSFHERWRWVYEWLHGELRTLEAIGALELSIVLFPLL